MSRIKNTVLQTFESDEQERSGELVLSYLPQDVMALVSRGYLHLGSQVRVCSQFLRNHVIFCFLIFVCVDISTHLMPFR